MSYIGGQHSYDWYDIHHDITMWYVLGAPDYLSCTNHAKWTLT